MLGIYLARGPLIGDLVSIIACALRKGGYRPRLTMTRPSRARMEVADWSGFDLILLLLRRDRRRSGAAAR